MNFFYRFICIWILVAASISSCTGNRIISYRDKATKQNVSNRVEKNTKKSESKFSENDKTIRYNAFSEYRSSNNFIVKWLSTPYQYGGTNIQGVDCSGLSSAYFKEVYHQQIARTAEEQYLQGNSISRAFLNEGDLVFFSEFRNGKITHVGIYLSEGNFLHASSSQGVVISNLNESYYRLRYVGAKRLIK